MVEWLAGHGYEDLVRNAIGVITDKEEVSARLDRDAAEDHLAGCAARSSPCRRTGEWMTGTW